jgi:hypothetical protein
VMVTNAVKKNRAEVQNQKFKVQIKEPGPNDKPPSRPCRATPIGRETWLIGAWFLALNFGF